ncbi:MAG TPA: DNA-binding protein [Lachnospiraceae bacterium]|nr:DNA-binding protein [Lachnospiraceae bacterium]
MNELFNTYPDVVEVSDLQEMLSIGRNSAYTLIRENKIKHFKVGKAIKIPKVYVIEFMQSICNDQQTPA